MPARHRSARAREERAVRSSVRQLRFREYVPLKRRQELSTRHRIAWRSCCASRLTSADRTIRSRGASSWETGGLRFRNRADRTRAQEERFDDLGTRPTERSTAREALLAQRILTRETEHQARCRSVYRRCDDLEPSHFLRHPTPTARLRVPGRECAAIRGLHGLTGEVESTIEQGAVPRR